MTDYSALVDSLQQCDCEACVERATKLKDAIEALRKDAERWRIARDYINVFPDGRFALALGEAKQAETDTNIDAVHLACDAAMKGGV